MESNISILLIINNLIFYYMIRNVRAQKLGFAKRRCFVIFEVTGDALGCHPLP